MDRLKTELRVQVWLRRCAGQGLMATVAHKGDADAGVLFVKVNRFAAGSMVFSSVPTEDASDAWLRATGPAAVPEKEADLHIARQIKYDPDMWVLEIEDPKSQFQLDGKILDI